MLNFYFFSTFKFKKKLKCTYHFDYSLLAYYKETEIFMKIIANFQIYYHDTSTPKEDEIFC